MKYIWEAHDIIVGREVQLPHDVSNGRMRIAYFSNPKRETPLTDWNCYCLVATTSDCHIYMIHSNVQDMADALNSGLYRPTSIEPDLLPKDFKQARRAELFPNEDAIMAFVNSLRYENKNNPQLIISELRKCR